MKNRNTWHNYKETDCDVKLIKPITKLLKNVNVM